jgi:DNA-binding transcriptional LysR family regulator
MVSLRRSVSSVGALVTFEAAARLGGFTLAADELGVSQAAVSRQIKLLEAELNTPLFTRAHRKVQLTPAGQALSVAVSGSFNRIAEVLDAIRHPNKAEVVTIGATLAFSRFWLLPRLPAFRAEHPQIKLRLLADDVPLDLMQDRLDVLIHYGQPPFAGAVSRAALADEVFPVCSPAVKARLEAEVAAGRLRHVPVIVSETVDPAWLNWRKWVAVAGPSSPWARANEQITLRCNHYTDSIQAAINGEGVALGWSTLLADLLDEGRLVRLADAGLRPEERYHVLVPDARSLGSHTRVFVEWIAAQFAPKA